MDRLRAAVRRGEAFRSALDLTVHLLRDQVDVLVQIVRETGINVDQIEDQLLSQRLHTNRADLGAMRRGLADHPHGFWVLVVLVATFTVLAGRWAFRKQAG